MGKRIQSPTSINTYLRCPRKYYLKYIKGCKTRPNIYLIRGTVVHKTIAAMSRIKFDSTGPSRQDTLIQIFKRTWKQHAGVINSLKLPQKVVDDFYRESLTMLLSWVERSFTSSSKNIQCELRLRSKIFGVMGIIDAVFTQDQRIILIDYKTCTSNKISQDIKVQLAIYALLYREHFNVTPDMVGIDFLHSNQRRLFHVDADLIRYAKDMCWFIHEKTRSKEEKNYPCHCSGRCTNDFDQ